MVLSVRFFSVFIFFEYLFVFRIIWYFLFIFKQVTYMNFISKYQKVSVKYLL